MKRHSTAVWQGSGKEGSGHLTTQSKVLDKTQYSFSSRFEEGTGTNPEELVAAAHAGCFAMKMTFLLGAEGFIPSNLETKCIINLVEGKIINSHLVFNAQVEGISEHKFAEVVKNAIEYCVISVVLNTETTIEYTLNK